MSDKYPGGFVTTGAPAGFSVAVTGTSSYLSVANNTAFDLPADFTIEMWVYFNVTTDQTLIAKWWTGGQQWVLQFRAAGTDSIANQHWRFYAGNGGQAAVDFQESSTTSVAIGTWYHIALTRSGSSYRIFRNGAQVGTTYTNATAITSTTDPLSIGQFGNNSSGGLNGYMSNVRIVKGTALYTTTFTPPTQLFPVTNTSILTCQSPTIVDNSANAFTITPTSATVSNFTPFAGYTGFNPALGAAAGGVWTIDEAAYYQNNRKWPIYDPYFNYTTMMLHGNGTNAAANNTFLDSSTNNFTVTRVGNTTQGTFTPFSPTGWCLYLPGSGTNYVQTPSSSTSTLLGGSLTSLASLSFTIECYINTPGNIFLVGACDPSGGTADMILGIGSDGLLSFGATFNGYTTRYSTGAAPLNTWCHVAWVVTGAYVYFYVNGAPAGSATVGNAASSYSQLIFGGYNNSFTSKEYISNFRITKSAIYTSAFTPPTGPLTATTNTTLLTFQGNSYKDYSANNYTLNVVNSPQMVAYSPFVPTVTTPTTYSNYFSGSASYLSGASNAALVFGTGTYTIEMWVYQNARSGTQYVLGGGGGFQLAINSSGYIFGGVAGVGDFTAATIAASLYTWTHIAIVRNSTSSGGVAYYVNGAAAGTATDATNYTSNVTLNIGTTNSNVGVTPFSGFLSNLRVLKGTALYTASFTPPTVPLTAITNTSLLTCQSTTIVDNSTNALTLTATGTVYPVASPTPFAAKVDQSTLNTAYSTSLIGGSAYFDGSGDYLTVPNNTAFSLPADFTIECWWYPTDLSGSSNVWCIGDSRSANNGLLLYWSSGAGKLLVYSNGSTTITSSITTPVNTWYHVAVVRSGSTITLYINGASVGTATNSTSFASVANNGFAICAEYAGSFGAGKAQYISGLRLVKGTALYTSSFAPPLTPPTAVANTQLLTNFTNAGIYDNASKTILETVSTAQISTAQSKFGGSSMKFNGTSDYLVTQVSSLVSGWTGDFTIEGWFYSLSNVNIPLWTNSTSNSDGANSLYVYTNGSIGFGKVGVNEFVSAAGLWTSNQWNHAVVVRSGATVYVYLNGVVVSSGAASTYVDTTVRSMTLGRQYQSSPVYYNGYIDDFRVTKGYARYTSNFTIPTSQLQDQ